MSGPASFQDLVREAKTRIRECTVEDVRRKLAAGERFVLVDVREDSEWAEGHARGALHIGKGILERDIAKHVPDRDTEVVLYCGGGFRSALAAESIARMGYVSVMSMDGGMRAWREAGLDVVT